MPLVVIITLLLFKFIKSLTEMCHNEVPLEYIYPVRITYKVCRKVVLKVRLRWFGAVLRCSGKYVLVFLSIDAIRRTIYH